MRESFRKEIPLSHMNMKRVMQFLCVLLGVPMTCFFLVMTIPVVLFAVPSVFIGNPLNILFVVWWGIGGYGIYSYIRATMKLSQAPFVPDEKHQIRVLLGILSFLPLIPLTLSGEIGFAKVSKYIIMLSAIGLIPACYLLVHSYASKPQ